MFWSRCSDCLCGVMMNLRDIVARPLQATLIRGKVYVFGGEDVRRRPQGGLWVLDLQVHAICKSDTHCMIDKWTCPGFLRAAASLHTPCFMSRVEATVTVLHDGYASHSSRHSHGITRSVRTAQDMSWSELKSSGGLADVAPSPRSAHVATAYLDRFLLVFGGGSVAHCYNDLHVFDTDSGTWEAVATEGKPPSPRAGVRPTADATVTAALQCFHQPANLPSTRHII